MEEAQQQLVSPKDSSKEEGSIALHAAKADIYQKFRKEMSSYLESVIRTRKAEDLQV